MALARMHLVTPAQPIITPPPELRARQTTFGGTAYDGDCFLSADNPCASEWDDACLFTGSQYEEEGYSTLVAMDESCDCSLAPSSWSCYSSNIVSLGCVTYYTGELTAYSRDFWVGYWEAVSDDISALCSGSVPPDIVSKAQQTYVAGVGATPTTTPSAITTTETVSLVVVSVVDVTPTTPVSVTPHTSLPTYSGSGTLLGGHCAQTSITILNDTSTAYVASFVGCDANRPECCPFTAQNAVLGTASGGGTVTLTATGTVTPTASVLTANSGYPVPLDGNQYATLTRCPADYTDLGTGCCPSGYLAFTRAIAGQTPCYSSLAVFGTTPVTLTAGVDYPLSAANGGTTSQASGGGSSIPTPTAGFPTSAVVNVVWAMQYPKSQSSSGLSIGAIVGIAIGSLVGVGAIAVLAVYLICVVGRKKKRAAAAAQQQPPAAAGPWQYQASVPPPPQYPPQYPPMAPAPGQPQYVPPQQPVYAPGVAPEPGKEAFATYEPLSPLTTYWTPSPDSTSPPPPVFQQPTPQSAHPQAELPVHAPLQHPAEVDASQRHEM